MSGSSEAFTTGQILTASELNALSTTAYSAVQPGGNIGSATCTTPPANATGNQVVDAAWVNTKIASVLTGLVTSVAGENGAVTVAQLIEAGLLGPMNGAITASAMLLLANGLTLNSVWFDGATGPFAGQTNYALQPTDLVVFVAKVTPSPTLLTVGAPGNRGKLALLLDALGQASTTNPITAQAASGSINGGTQLITTPYGGIMLIDNGTLWNVAGVID